MSSRFENLPNFVYDEVGTFFRIVGHRLLANRLSKTCSRNFARVEHKGRWITLQANCMPDPALVLGCRCITIEMQPFALAEVFRLARVPILELACRQCDVPCLPRLDFSLPQVKELILTNVGIGELLTLRELFPNVTSLSFSIPISLDFADFSQLTKLQTFSATPLADLSRRIWGATTLSSPLRWAPSTYALHALRLPSSVTDLTLHPCIELLEFDSARVQRFKLAVSLESRIGGSTENSIMWTQTMRPSEWPSLTDLRVCAPFQKNFFDETWRLQRLRICLNPKISIDAIAQRTGETLKSLTLEDEIPPFVDSMSLHSFIRLETLYLRQFNSQTFRDLKWPACLRNTLRSVKLTAWNSVGRFESEVLAQLENLEHFHLGPAIEELRVGRIASFDVDALQPLQKLRTLQLTQVGISWNFAKFPRLQDLTLCDVCGFDWEDQTRFCETDDLRRLDCEGPLSHEPVALCAQLRRFKRLESVRIGFAKAEYRPDYCSCVPPSCRVTFH